MTTLKSERISRRPMWLGATVLLVTGISGVLVGVALDRTVLIPTDSFPRRAPMPPGMGPGMGPGRGQAMAPSPAARHQFVLRLARELELTDSQQQQVEALIERQLPKIRVTMDSVQRLLESEMKESRTELSNILTPQQQEKFAKLRPTPFRRP